jgi:hypothetical protein
LGLTSFSSLINKPILANRFYVKASVLLYSYIWLYSLLPLLVPRGLHYYCTIVAVHDVHLCADITDRYSLQGGTRSTAIRFMGLL